MTEWQPIETAPRDGTRFYVSHELDPNSRKESRYFGMTVAQWHQGKLICSTLFTCSDGFLRKNPTHWTPITEPPA